MTDLTDKWKKGELLEGFYYVKCDWSDEVEIRYVHNSVDDWEEIVAEVPTYEEWQRILHYAGKYEVEYTSCVMDYENLKEENAQLKKWCEEFNALEVSKENTKLKELLKRVNEHFGWIDRVEPFYVEEELWDDIKKALG